MVRRHSQGEIADGQIVSFHKWASRRPVLLKNVFDLLKAAFQARHGDSDKQDRGHTHRPRQRQIESAAAVPCQRERVKVRIPSRRQPTCQLERRKLGKIKKKMKTCLQIGGCAKIRIESASRLGHLASGYADQGEHEPNTTPKRGGSTEHHNLSKVPTCANDAN